MKNMATHGGLMVEEFFLRSLVKKSKVWDCAFVITVFILLTLVVCVRN